MYFFNWNISVTSEKHETVALFVSEKHRQGQLQTPQSLSVVALHERLCSFELDVLNRYEDDTNGRTDTSRLTSWYALSMFGTSLYC
jgi:hypothetical protein